MAARSRQCHPPRRLLLLLVPVLVVVLGLLLLRTRLLRSRRRQLGRRAGRAGCAALPPALAAGGLSRLAVALHALDGLDSGRRRRRWLRPARFTPRIEHPLCGSADLAQDSDLQATSPAIPSLLPHSAARFAASARASISLCVVTWRSPKTLRRSLESWRRGGLLDLADERLLVANDASQDDKLIAREFGFTIVSSKLGENVMVGGAMLELVAASSADVILFLEKDFELFGATASAEPAALAAVAAATARELFVGVQHLMRGSADVYRLRGTTDMGSDGMKDCCAKRADCPWQNAFLGSGGHFADSQNYLLVWCDPRITETSSGRVARCSSEPADPESLCYTSADSVFSNNPMLFRRSWFDAKVRSVALGRLEDVLESNHLFEQTLTLDWLAWQPAARICTSLLGLFRHVEIDGLVSGESATL